MSDAPRLLQLVLVTVCLLPVVHCSLLPGLGGLVTQPLDSLGYVPLEAALATCEAGARRDLEQEIARYNASAWNRAFIFLTLKSVW